MAFLSYLKNNIVLILFIVAILIICVYIIKQFISKIYSRFNNSNDNIYITLTTIPERLANLWFYKNLKYLMNLNGDFKVVLNIPYKWKKTGEEYIIPDNIRKLEKNNLIINRVDKDYGPITKLFGALLNDNIPDNSCLLICDDDIVYKSDFVISLYNEYIKDDTKIYSSCFADIQGYKGFMVKKSIIKPILNYKMPESCFRIDDNYMQDIIVKKMKIDIIGVPYNKDNLWTCSMEQNETNTHPKWEELVKDNREPMVKKCIEDINKINKL